jgi:hypothetical protein
MGRSCSQNGRKEGGNVFKNLTGTSTGKRFLGRPRCRWEDNIKMDFGERGINTRNLIDSAQDRDYWRSIVNGALNLRIPQAMELVN